MTFTRRQAFCAAFGVTLACALPPKDAKAYENPNGGQHFDRGRFPRTGTLDKPGNGGGKKNSQIKQRASVNRNRGVDRDGRDDSAPGPRKRP
jgi:hypothetical protein